MAKKNTSKNTHQQKNAKKTAPKAKTTATEQDITEQESVNETDVLQEYAAIESVENNTQEPTLTELVDEQEVDVSVFNPNEPIEILFVLGEEEAEEQPNAEIQEPTDVITATGEPETKSKKARNTKLGTAKTALLAGCSYHFFRKYFKKRYAEEGIKVRFVKAATGYNGHIEVAETDIERAKGIILKIKSEQMNVKNLFWFL